MPSLNPHNRDGSIGVVMAVRNAFDTVRAALDSVLKQTYPPSEVVIVDDASNDGTLDILSSYRDPRIKLLVQSHQRGVAHSLNIAFRATESSFIARMDADDISYRHRFASQIAVMERDERAAVVGSSVRLMDADNRLHGILALPEDYASICGYASMSPPFRHPAVMIRRSALCELPDPYNCDFEGAEDYELWTKLLPFHRAYNIKAPLLAYRVHHKSVTSRQRTSQAVVHAAAAQKFARAMAGDVEPSVFTPLANAIVLNKKVISSELAALCETLRRVNGGIADRLESSHDIRFAAREQYYILLKLAIKSKSTVFSRLVSEMANDRAFSLFPRSGGPALRDMRRICGMMMSRVGHQHYSQLP